MGSSTQTYIHVLGGEYPSGLSSHQILTKGSYVSGTVSDAGKIAKNRIAKIPAFVDIDIKQGT